MGELRGLVALVVLASATAAFARVAISIRWPARRLWPPPEAEGPFTRAFGRLSSFGASLGVPVAAVFDWNSFVFEHGSRYALAAALVAAGAGAGLAHRHLGSAESSGRAPADGALVLRSDGPYAHSRNPQYVGAVPVYFGVAIAANSALALIVATLVSATLLLSPLAEEPWCEERFGQAFRDYAARVPRFLSPGASRLLMLVCLAALPGDFLVTLLPGVVYPGYDPVSQFMSELAVPGRPGHGPLTVWWPFYGTTLVAMGGLWAASLGGSGVRRWLGPGLLALTGLGLGIVTGVHPCDAGCAVLTRSGAIHQAWGLVGMLALTAAPFAFAVALRHDPRWRGLAPFSLLAGLGGCVGFALQAAAGAPDSELAAVRGLIQRGALLWSYLWLAVLGWRWLRTGPVQGEPPA